MWAKILYQRERERERERDLNPKGPKSNPNNLKTVSGIYLGPTYKKKGYNV
jgi:hypothetical protein